jgi:hypothetical protein
MVHAKFRSGVQGVVLGTGPFATTVSGRFLPFKVGVIYWAHTLQAPVRMLLFMLLVVIARSVCWSDHFVMIWFCSNSPFIWEH